MSRTRKHKKRKTGIGKKKGTVKKLYRLPNVTPVYIQGNIQVNSYSPTVNRDLVMLQSMPREKTLDCNNEKAFELKEPLQIGIPGKLFGKTCEPYYSQNAVRFLLKNLSANKHLQVDKIIPPIQNESNCWFNTMFVTLFVSDKGRKFFHFFRQLMIEGIQSNGSAIPTNLRNGFALLNYAIDACLTGNKYAYVLNTNAIIRNIHDNIPDAYKRKFPFLTGVGQAGNPLRYYLSLIYYLHNKSLQVLFLENGDMNWKERVVSKLSGSHMPHIIVLEFYDKQSETTTNKPRSFSVKGIKYVLDSAVIRDTSQQHFCASLTCEQKEMTYDGMSFHRLVPMAWKQNINSEIVWEFEGSNNTDGTPLKWNFRKGYQMLMYYRVK